MAKQQGVAHHSARLTPRTVRRIRARLDAGGVTMGALALKYGVSPVAIWKIHHRQSWKSI